MKNFLFCLLLLAGLAAANTCTEAVFKLSKGSLDIKKGEAYHDSSYFMENYYKENISVVHLASLCNISVVHLRNCFIKSFAVSPVKYINSLKLTRAKELIESGMYSVGDVCFLSGYNDESYFSREFKKSFKKSPKEYAKASRK